MHVLSRMKASAAPELTNAEQTDTDSLTDYIRKTT